MCAQVVGLLLGLPYCAKHCRKHSLHVPFLKQVRPENSKVPLSLVFPPNPNYALHDFLGTMINDHYTSMHHIIVLYYIYIYPYYPYIYIETLSILDLWPYELNLTRAEKRHPLLGSPLPQRSSRRDASSRIVSNCPNNLRLAAMAEIYQIWHGQLRLFHVFSKICPAGTCLRHHLDHVVPC